MDRIKLVVQYLDHFEEAIRRDRSSRRHHPMLEGITSEFLSEMWEYYQTRQIAFEEAQKKS